MIQSFKKLARYHQNGNKHFKCSFIISKYELFPQYLKHNVHIHIDVLHFQIMSYQADLAKHKVEISLHFLVNTWWTLKLYFIFIHIKSSIMLVDCAVTVYSHDLEGVEGGGGSKV